MRILKATHLGQCFGVRDAIALAHQQSAQGPLTILGDLVHNPTVLAGLHARGIETTTDPAAIATPTALITAHGASERTRARVRSRGVELLEATCPLVHLVHQAVERLVRDGFHPVIVGQRHHTEVRGLTEDLDACDVVLTEAEVDGLAERPRFGVVAQTTQPIDRVRSLAAALRRRFPRSEVRLVDTVCQPTKQRQHAAVELAHQCSVVVVVGGAQSNNTRELVATCQRPGVRVHHVETVADLRPEWFEAADTVGLTAGTSTPDEVIEAVELRLREWAVPAQAPGTDRVAHHAATASPA